MKNFLSKNFISILIGIFIILGLLKSDLLDFGSSSETPLKKGDFFVYNHSAIHAIYHQGEFKPEDLRTISDLMDELALFQDNQPSVLGLVKTDDNLNVLRMTTEAYQQEGVPEEFIYRYSAAAYSIKSKLYPDLPVHLQFTNQEWVAHQTLDENQIKENVAKYGGNTTTGALAASPQVNGFNQQTLERWMIGATILAQANYYFPVDSNDDWRIYYSDLVTEQTASLAQIMAEAKFFTPGVSNYLAFYTQADPAYFNGEASYVVAIPFEESHFRGESANAALEAIHNYLKESYFSQANLLTIATDFDFKPQLVQY